jgi:hypothetical protein
MNFFPCHGSFDYDYDFAPESKRSKKIVSLHSTFMYSTGSTGTGIHDEKLIGSGSGMKKWSDPGPG